MRKISLTDVTRYGIIGINKGDKMLTEQQAKDLCEQIVRELPAEIFNEISPRALAAICGIINRNIIEANLNDNDDN